MIRKCLKNCVGKNQFSDVLVRCIKKPFFLFFIIHLSMFPIFPTRSSRKPVDEVLKNATKTLRTLISYTFGTWERERKEGKNVKLMTIAIFFLKRRRKLFSHRRNPERDSDALSSYSSFLSDFFPRNLKTVSFSRSWWMLIYYFYISSSARHLNTQQVEFLKDPRMRHM